MDEQRKPLLTLRDALDRLFDDGISLPELPRIPKVDIRETDNDVILEADLPGTREEDVNVEISSRMVMISGELKKETKDKEGGYLYRERYSGSFRRNFTLPAEVKSEESEAEFRDGVLTITMPKAEVKKPSRIKIVRK